MKDVLSLAVFAAKLLCLMVFVAILKPDNIGTIQTSAKPVDCRIGRSGMQECGLNVFAAASQAGAKPCIARPSVAHC